jgi:hypothetical protein
MYHSVLGTFHSRDPLPETDPVLMGRSLYEYVGNNPVNRTDPSGLQPEGGPAKPPPAKPPETFYICSRNTELGNAIDKCGCQHTDIYGDKSGPVYIGFGGGVARLDQGGLPKGSGWTRTPLSPISSISQESPLGLGRFEDIPLTMKSGPGAGKSCKDATQADILACLQATPKPPGNSGLISNCQTNVLGTAQDCCLGSNFKPVTIIPARPFPRGPKL